MTHSFLSVAKAPTTSHRRYQVTYIDDEGREKRVSTTVAQHPGAIPAGTLRAIERDLAPAFGPAWLGGGTKR